MRASTSSSAAANPTTALKNNGRCGSRRSIPRHSPASEGHVLTSEAALLVRDGPALRGQGQLMETESATSSI